MEIAVDRDVCVGAGMCALTAPTLFTQDEEEGLVEMMRPAEPGDEPSARRW